jgi:Flp pilus assembly protein TadD
MMPGLLHLRAFGMLLACTGATVAFAAPAAAQGAYSAYAESPAAALARHVRTLASSPKDFAALIGAGRAALQLGDSQAAAGFFARADEVNPRSPLPQAGMGAVSVANGEPQASFAYFARAQKLGASLATIGCDRGLAFDLTGQQAQAQADYRAALHGPDADEARRRLALSLAISGDKSGALQALAPLAAKGDPAANRTRAFVLALSGDSNGAMVAIDAAMPGSWARVSPFLQRLPALQAGQKAAAVNLGIFPEAGETAYAFASPSVGSPTTMSTDRLAGVDALLGAPPTAPQANWQPAQQPSWQAAPKPVQVAYSAPPKRSQVAAQVRPRKLWLQLASGSDADSLPRQFERMKSRDPELFDGIEGYVVKSADRARLLVGPFRGSSDARIFADDLRTAGINAFSWTNSPTDVIVPVGTE